MINPEMPIMNKNFYLKGNPGTFLCLNINSYVVIIKYIYIYIIKKGGNAKP